MDAFSVFINRHKRVSHSFTSCFFFRAPLNSVTRLSTLSCTILSFLVTEKRCFACAGSSVPYRSAHEPLIPEKIKIEH